MRKWCTIFLLAVFLSMAGGPNVWAQQATFHNLGHYPGGTWAEPWGINKAGVIVGMGDNSSGYTRPIGVPLYGPNARQWFDLGTLGGDTADYVMCMDIADTGMIVGHTAIAGNAVIHPFVWTHETGMVDIGSLADAGYDGYVNGIVWGTNRSGTLLVGWSSTGIDRNGPDGPSADSYPVVWTPKMVWDSGKWKMKWRIHKLDTNGFESFTYWTALHPNDHGRIVGMAQGTDGTLIGVVWNPVWGRDDWEIQQLPTPPGYNTVWPSEISNNGEIVGDVATTDWSSYFPAYWKPTGHSGNNYSVTILPTLGGYLSGVGDGEGINDEGDIVGGSTDAKGNYYATAWSAKDPKFAPRLLPSPHHSGSGSFAARVNNNGVVAGSYWNDEVSENTAAWILR